MPDRLDRETSVDTANPIGMDGVEFIEFTTPKPQALGHVLETMGFQPVARHRAREVLLYRQGEMNIVVNAHDADLARAVQPADSAAIAAIGIRVRDAASAYRTALERGAWAVPTHAEVMELNIPAIHGVGQSRIYFVDRYREFSIWDVDFVPIPTVDPKPPAVCGLHWFGVVQYIGNDRMEDWTEFYREILGFAPVPDDERHGIMPKGRVLRSACGSFHLQLIEPEPGILDLENDEDLRRIGFGTPDVLAAVKALQQRGMAFVESANVHSSERGALTVTALGGAIFELVHDDPAAAS
ncbi:MAG: VOC family protein [Burkholderiaceae bacterium]